MIDLRLGDCLEVLPTLATNSVDAVIMDPPYNVGQTGYSDRRMDFAGWIRRVVEDCLRISTGPVVLTMASTRIFDCPRPDWIGVWHKPYTSGFWSTPLIPHWEALLFYRPTKAVRSDVFAFNPAKKAEGNGHPTPKPISLMRTLVSISALADTTVLDPFMGSGTTGVACVQTGRNFIGIEIDPGFFAIAQCRIAAAESQSRLEFVVADEPPEQFTLEATQ